MEIILGILLVAALLTVAAPIVAYGLYALLIFWPFILAYYILEAHSVGGVDWQEYWLLSIGMMAGWLYALHLMGKDQNKPDDDADW